MSESINGEAVTKIADLAKNAAGIEIVNVNISAPGLPSSFPVAFDKRTNGAGLKELAVFAETWRTAPSHRKGTSVVTTLQSFIDLTNRHKDTDSAIFASTSWPRPSLTAVLNYHKIGPDGAPRFGDHRVRYEFPVTDEFQAWAKQNAEAMNQGEFAAFIEERASELTNPTEEERNEFEGLFQTKIATPSEMIVLSRGLQVNVAGVVKQATTLSSGEGEVVFVEEHQNNNGEKLTVPGLFMIALPAFLDGDPVRIPARLRYRVRAGTISWFFQLYRWKELLRDRVVADLDQAESETTLPTYEGSPEA